VKERKLKSLCNAITHEKEKLKKQYFAQQFNIHQSNPAHLVNKQMGKSHTKYIPNLITSPLTQNQSSDLQQISNYSINTSHQLAQIWQKKQNKLITITIQTSTQ